MPSYDSLQRGTKHGRQVWGVVLVGIVCAGLLLLLAVLHAKWGGHLVVRTIDYAVQNLASRSGLSLFLVRGIVILVTIPFFWAVAKYTRGLFWLRGVHPSLRLYRNPYGIIIVSYVGAFFLAMYFASREAYFYKWCGDTPEGIRTFDAAGVDPIYGIQLKPCSFEQIVSLRQNTVGLSGPQRVQIENPREFAFFDAISGSPRVWYYKTADGRYEIYDRAGKHPGTGQSLRPIGAETRQELVRLQQEEERQRAEQVAQRAAAESQRQHQAFLERYLNTAVVKRKGTAAAILILREGEDSMSEIEEFLARGLTKIGVEPVRVLFKPQFVQEGHARNLFAGDWREAKQLELANRVDYVFLGLGGANYTSNREFEGLSSVSLRLEVKCFNVVAQKMCGVRSILAHGAGYTKAEAFGNAATNAEPLLESYVKALQLH